MSSYYPSLEEVKELSKQGNLIPLYREINADLETPVSAYLKIAEGAYSYLLESVEGGEQLARYSFIGTEPYKVVKTGPGQPYGEVDPLTLIEEELNRHKLVSIRGLPRFHGGAVGFIAYDVVRYYEPVPPPATDPLGLPEAVFLFVDTLLVFDHVSHKIKVVSHVHTDGESVEKSYKEAVARIDRLVDRLDRPLLVERSLTRQAEDNPGYTSNMTQERYEAMVEQVKEYIYAGDIIQAVPSQRLARPTSAAPLDIYRALRTLNPSPYMYYLSMEGFSIVGASPELLVRVENGLVYNFPLAGTRPRGATTEEDEALAAELQADEKERAEHIMLVDLGRNDVGRVSKPGTVEVTDLMRVVRYSHVMHLESEVQGSLRTTAPSTMPSAPAFPPARCPAPPRSGQWRSSRSRRASGAAPTAARLDTSASPATWTPPSPSAPWSSRTVWPTSRRAAESWPTACRRASTRRHCTRPGPACGP